MRFTNRLVAVAASTAMVGAGLLAVTATTASAAAPTGGCWVYTPTNAANIEDATPASSTSTSLALWADAAGPAPDYNLTSTGSTTVGGTRNFSLTFNVGPKNGGPPASGTVYYYFSANGVNLPVISKAFSAGGAATIPGDTIAGSYTLTGSGNQSVKLRKVIYDIPTFFTRVQCNGQSSGVSGGVNPATTPLDTNIASGTFNVVGPTATVTSITNQAAGVTNFARLKDRINVSVTNFAAGTATASLCNAAGTVCDPTTGTFPVAADGTGAGFVAVGTTVAAPTTGARYLKIASGSDTTLTPITIGPAQPTTVTNAVGGGAGTIVTVSGDGWDPNQTLLVGGYKAPGGQSGATTADPAQPAVMADATGHFSTTFVVNDPETAFIQTFRMHNVAGAPPVVLFGSVPFQFSGDDCKAKAGAATTGTCSLLQTVKLKVIAGDLKMSKEQGDVILSDVQLDGTAQNATGALQERHRAGLPRWHPGLVADRHLHRPQRAGGDRSRASCPGRPSCVKAANNDDTVTTGAAGAFDEAARQPALLGRHDRPGCGRRQRWRHRGRCRSVAVAARQPGAGDYTGTINADARLSQASGRTDPPHPGGCPRGHPPGSPRSTAGFMNSVNNCPEIDHNRGRPVPTPDEETRE